MRSERAPFDPCRHNTTRSTMADKPATAGNELSGSCDSCHRNCAKLRRCTRCYVTAYCGKGCQRRHWKSTHRQECHPAADGPSAVVAAEPGGAAAAATKMGPERAVTSVKAEAAAAELSQILASSSLGDAEKDFHLAKDEMDRLRREDTSKTRGKTKGVFAVDSEGKKDSRPDSSKMGTDNSSSSEMGLESIASEALGAIGVASEDECPPFAASVSPLHLETTEASSFATRSDTFVPPKTQPLDTAGSSQNLSRDGVVSMLSSKGDPTRNSVHPNQGQWSFFAERLANIFCYSVTIKPCSKGVKSIPATDHLRLKIEQTNATHTRIILSTRVPVSSEKVGGEVMMDAILPGIIHPNDGGIRINAAVDCITLRLPYKGESLPVGSESKMFSPGALTDADAINSVRCRSCGHSLLGELRQTGRTSGKQMMRSSRNEGSAINKVLPLPVGNWDEIIEYLTCYEGQPAVDLSTSSTEAVSGMALEDPSILVLHASDVGANVCVLAVDGYGEPSSEHESVDRAGDAGVEYRGARPWRDAAGGATVCCSACCSSLGFVGLHSTDTFRLFKHRLSCGATAISRGKDVFVRNTGGSFLAAEMVRYAETRAVFTFVVGQQGVGRAKCLLLRLLSWDSWTVAGGTGSAATAHELDFMRTAKLIYEEVDDLTAATPNSIDHLNDPSDPSTWSWGGVDLCCPPPPLNTAVDGDDAKHLSGMGNPQMPSVQSDSSASVRIELSLDEWLKLRETLVVESKQFSKSVKDVTVMLKLGKKGEIIPGSAGLSILPLLD